ncbi:UPF0496 protein At3g49070 [Mercurialis annua]|uniref:UPF0496 protein At3g49070 n=1 Tax=Mercurialis annua TaxID=3986 RepID=UPI00215E879F|nr:UPF0496 protein At3g49070 [Mercurialis annua]
MIKRIKFVLGITESNGRSGSTNPPVGVDVREEYANAFRTQSYNQFWTRVLALSDGNSAPGIPVESTTAARLPSYRLFVENLLDPDQSTVSQILNLTHNTPKAKFLLSEYFTQTANVSFLCGLLIKNIDRTRIKYRSLKTAIQSTDIAAVLTEFAKSNPFLRSGPSLNQVRVIQADCSKLLKRLESSRDKAKAKLHLNNKLKHGSALFAVTLTASLAIILATHALALLVAAPSLMTAASMKLASSRRLAKVSAQLDMAAKGTYILCKDLETVSRLVARLTDEMEHMKARIEFWMEIGEVWVRANEEVVRLDDVEEQLDDVEEHLYLCFMTINRARNLVLKEILNPGQFNKAPNILFMT